MITPENNPFIYDESVGTGIPFAATRDLLVDTDIYSRYVYACESMFRKSRFYKDYKSNLFNMGLDRDQMMAGITSEIADLELHHHFPQLKQATIMVTEHLLNTKGCCTTFEVVKAIEDAHRNNEMGIIFLSKTNHQNYHTFEGSSFISLNQCFGNPFAFIDKYRDGMTMDISFKLLLQLKKEEQYAGQSFTPQMAQARDQILSWQRYIPN